MINRKLYKLLAKRNITNLCLDIDGVMTNGEVTWVPPNIGVRSYNTLDGRGIIDAQAKGLRIFVTSHCDDMSVVDRLRKLNIPVVNISYNRFADKTEALVAMLISETDIDDPCDEASVLDWLSQTAYIGDDVNDLKVMSAVGLALCPSTAHPSVIYSRDTDLVLKTGGGKGCIREFTDTWTAYEDDSK